MGQCARLRTQERRLVSVSGLQCRVSARCGSVLLQSIDNDATHDDLSPMGQCVGLRPRSYGWYVMTAVSSVGQVWLGPPAV